MASHAHVVGADSPGRRRPWPQRHAQVEVAGGGRRHPHLADQLDDSGDVAAIGAVPLARVIEERRVFFVPPPRPPHRRKRSSPGARVSRSSGGSIRTRRRSWRRLLWRRVYRARKSGPRCRMGAERLAEDTRPRREPRPTYRGATHPGRGGSALCDRAAAGGTGRGHRGTGNGASVLSARDRSGPASPPRRRAALRRARGDSRRQQLEHRQRVPARAGRAHEGARPLRRLVPASTAASGSTSHLRPLIEELCRGWMCLRACSTPI